MGARFFTHDSDEGDIHFSEPGRGIKTFPGGINLPGGRSPTTGTRFFTRDSDRGDIPLSESCQKLRHIFAEKIDLPRRRFLSSP